MFREKCNFVIENHACLEPREVRGNKQLGIQRRAGKLKGGSQRRWTLRDGEGS